MPARFVLRIAAALQAILLTSALMLPAVASAATWTDQADYSPGSVVTISGDNSNGAGYLAGETVDVAVSGPNGWPASCSGTADADGAWSCQITLDPDPDIAVGDYSYTATGEASGVFESGVFSDARPQSVSVGAPTSATILQGGTANYGTLTAAFNGNSTSCTVDLTAAGLPANATATFGSSSLTSTGTDQTTSLSVSTTAAVATGTYTFHIVATPSSGTCQSGSSTQSSGDLTLIVNPPAPTDTTPPVISYILNPASPDGSNGWYKSDVTLMWVVTEAESPGSLVKTGCVNQNITADQSATTYSCSATSDGGSAGPVSVTIKRDATAPTGVTTTLDSSPDHNGWYNAPVGWTTSGVDATSGIDACDSGTYSGPDSSGVTVSGTCTDLAGNTSASAESSAFMYDATAPNLTPTVSPNPVVLNGNATASPNASDATSGIDTASCDQVDASAIGSFSVDCDATDNAGNMATASANYNVIYGVCGYDKATVKSGATLPIKLFLCDANGANVSDPAVVVKATSLKKTDNTATGAVEDSGNANPDSNFRSVDGGYIFNLSTKSPSPALGAGTTKLATGTWKLCFSVDGVGGYSLSFDVK
jgi:hypothetical protein